MSVERENRLKKNCGKYSNVNQSRKRKTIFIWMKYIRISCSILLDKIEWEYQLTLARMSHHIIIYFILIHYWTPSCVSVPHSVCLRSHSYVGCVQTTLLKEPCMIVCASVFARWTFNLLINKFNLFGDAVMFVLWLIGFGRCLSVYWTPRDNRQPVCSNVKFTRAFRTFVRFEIEICLIQFSRINWSNLQNLRLHVFVGCAIYSDVNIEFNTATRCVDYNLR